MSDETKPGSGTERPHATLDLKAERVDAPEKTPDEETQTTGDGAREPDDVLPAREGSGTASFLTHLSAGLLGGLIALVIGYYALGNFRDRLPFIAETSAEQIKATQAQLEQRIAEVADDSSAARAELADRVAALDARTEGLAQTDDEAVAALTARLQALEQQLQAASTTTGDAARADQVEAVRSRLTGIEESIASLRAGLDDVRAQTKRNAELARSSAQTLAVNRLRRAVDGGGPFTAELDALRQVAGGPLEADALAAAAQDGVPSLRNLRQSFPEFANRALEAVGAKGDSSLIGQIVESARSVVNVRPVGEIEGDSPRAIIARVENRLNAGDLQGVVEQSDQLSGEAAVQLLPWIQQVKTRINANIELSSLEARMLDGIPQ
jgi:hypothetical protein